MEKSALVALNKCHTVLNCVDSYVVCGCDELFDDWFKHQRRDQHLRRARVKNGVRRAFNRKGLVLAGSETHRLETSGPEKVIVEPDGRTCILVELKAFHLREIRFAKIHSGRLICAITVHRKGESLRRNFECLVQSVSEQGSYCNLLAREHHLFVLTQAENSFDRRIETSLVQNCKICEV